MAECVKTVMILGAGVMQLPAIRIAREKGWKVIVADGNSSAPGAVLADIFENVDLKDREKLLEKAIYHDKHGGLDGVFTAGTDFSYSVACLTELLGLPGVSRETALNATDKGRMRDVFRSRGVPIPEYRSFAREEMPDVGRSRWNFPVVVKPVDNMGARGVAMARDPDELRESAESAMRYSRSGRIIVEELIRGREFSIDALVYRGRIRICGIADRHIFFLPWFVELGHTMPSRTDKNTLAELVRVFRSGIEALGIENGAAKGDVFMTPGGAVVGEIAARLSGGYMSGWTYPYSSGVEVTGAALNISVGLPPGNLVPRRRWTSAERAFISIPGTVREILGLDDARAIPGVRDVFSRVEPGFRVKFPENNVEKCGNIISALPHAKAAIDAAESAVSGVFIRLEKGDPGTAAFLFGKEPPAYPAYVPAEQLRRSISEMPVWLEAVPDREKVRELGPFRILDAAMTGFSGPDWNHRSAGDALAFLSRLFEKTPAPSWNFDLVPAKVFWHAFSRGGVQGAAWLLETLHSLNGIKEAKAVITEWECANS